jgi:hypothetical protein
MTTREPKAKGKSLRKGPTTLHTMEKKSPGDVGGKSRRRGVFLRPRGHRVPVGKCRRGREWPAAAIYGRLRGRSPVAGGILPTHPHRPRKTPHSDSPPNEPNGHDDMSTPQLIAALDATPLGELVLLADDMEHAAANAESPGLRLFYVAFGSTVAMRADGLPDRPGVARAWVHAAAALGDAASHAIFQASTATTPPLYRAMRQELEAGRVIVEVEMALWADAMAGVVDGQAFA